MIENDVITSFVETLVEHSYFLENNRFCISMLEEGIWELGLNGLYNDIDFFTNSDPYDFLWELVSEIEYNLYDEVEEELFEEYNYDSDLIINLVEFEAWLCNYDEACFEDNIENRTESDIIGFIMRYYFYAMEE